MDHSDHMYRFPDGDELYQVWRYKVHSRLLPNLVEVFGKMGHPVRLTMSEGDRELYLGDIGDFEDELGVLSADLEEERAALLRSLDSNHWLTPGDREGILAQYDVKMATMSEMRRSLQETRTIALSEDVVEP